MAKLTPLILCGGSGTRLWPVSRQALPKQFADIGLAGTLFELTLERAAAVGTTPPLIVCGAAHVMHVADQLKGEARVIVEPAARNTAAAVLAACLTLPLDALVLMMPSDHFMPDHAYFASQVSRMARLAAQGCLVQMGIRATHATSSYGYLLPGTPTGEGFNIACMKEKPTVAQAEQLIAEGYLWNSGLLAFQVDTLLAEFEAHAPDILAAVRAAMPADCKGARICPAKDAYLEAPSLSLDYAILEHTQRSVVVPYVEQWSDLGTWASLHAQFERDTADNVVRGEVVAHDTTGSLILAQDRLVCTSGVRDLVVVETADAVLVADRNQPDSVKHVVDMLHARGHETAVLPSKVLRPWGWYQSLSKDDAHQTKRLHVNHGEAISLQYHHKRSEHWVVIKGEATVQLGIEVLKLTPGQSVYIPAGTIHRLSAENGDIDLVEVQTGTYFGEDDIIRIADNYARH